MLTSNDWYAVTLSLKVAVVATLINIAIGLPVAYILARKRFRGKALLDTFVTLPLVLPPTVVGFYLLFLFGREGFLGKILNELFDVSIVLTWFAAVLAAQVVSMPLMIRASKAAIADVDIGYENVSYTLGRSKLYTFFRVTLPMAKRGIITGVALTFCRALGEFGATMMIAGNIPGQTQTMPVAIYSAFYSSEEYKMYFFVGSLTLISFAAIILVNRLEKLGDGNE